MADESNDNPHAVKVKSDSVGGSGYQMEGDIFALRKYNDEVTKSDRLENWIMPLYDGLNMARLLD